MKLRPYQADMDRRINAAWASGHRNVLAVLPTGAGKTVTFGKIIHDHHQAGGMAGAIAHRSELVGQISMALGRYGVRHRIIAPAATVRKIEGAQMRTLGRRFVDPHARAWVAGVNTLVNFKPGERFLLETSLWVQDEAHHVLRENLWGRAAELLPNARGLGVTATPFRADGQGLGRHADGLMDVLIDGPTMRQLIDMGYLTDYKLIASEVAIDLSDVPVSDTTGEYVMEKLRQAVHADSHIVGDVVAEYLKHAPGLLGITFAVDVEEAVKIAAAFRAANVPAEVVHAKTPVDLRDSIMRRFAAGEILQLVNVDLFGEGFDLPAVRVVSMARPTMSKALYDQQFGRALRLLLPVALAGAWDTYSDEQRRAFIAGSEKPFGIIIDHVGNWLKHGVPDGYRPRSLDRREKRASSKTAGDAIPVKVCANANVGGLGVVCGRDYLASLPCCPHCGFKPEPVGRSAPAEVEGDLGEVSPEVLAALRGDIAKIDGPPTIPYGASAEVAGSVKRRHWERQQAQAALRANIALWAGGKRAQGMSDTEIYRAFWYMFGTDIATAQTLGRPDAEALNARVAAQIAIDGFVNIGQSEGVQ